MQLSTIDISVFAIYVVALIGIAYWVSREKAGHQKNTKDYFLAGNSLPWWAVGASLIAANISAEQIIGHGGACPSAHSRNNKRPIEAYIKQW